MKNIKPDKIAKELLSVQPVEPNLFKNLYDSVKRLAELRRTPVNKEKDVD